MPRVRDDGHSVHVGERTSLRRTDETGKLRNICLGMRRMLQIAHQSRRVRPSGTARPARPISLKQRSAVRVTYMTPKSAGHWYAHGSYMERETAAGKNGGFTDDKNRVSIATTLQSWQAAGDQRVFKLIISPENAARLDMEAYTRGVMAEVEKDKGTKLEWVAAVHHNTDHPHVHVAIRGVYSGGKELRFDKEYVKEGFRSHAEEIATRHLGYRTEKELNQDIVRQVTQARVTGLDRQVEKLAGVHVKGTPFIVSLDNPMHRNQAQRNAVRAYALERRLQHLVSMGMATEVGKGVFEVKPDFMETLRTVQVVGDKQKMLTRHMAAASSTTLPVVSAQWRDIQVLQGRVLGHGEVEGSEKRYMLLEGIDGKIYHLPHRKDTEELRAQRHLRKGEFVTINRERGKVQFVEMGNADHLLQKKDLLAHFPYTAPTSEPQRPGWLGRFDAAVVAAQREMKTERGADRVAVPLSKDQVRTLLRGEYPGDNASQERTYRKLFDTGDPVRILGGKVALDYQTSSGSPFADIDIRDKPLLDKRLRELTDAAQRQQRQRTDRTRQEKDRERD